MREWLSGRASPCQGERREFESRLPLHLLQDKRRKNMRLLLFVSGAIAKCVRPPGGQGAAGPLGASGHPSRRGQLYPGLSGGGRPYPQAPEAGLHRPGLSAAGSGPF